MLTLLVKDFKLMFIKEKSVSKRIVSAIFSLLFLAAFLVVEIFLFTAILNKIKNFTGAAPAFMTLFLFVISMLMIIMSVFQAKKLFFDEKDIEQLSSYPVSNSQIILSKLLFLFLLHYATSFVFVYPLFIAYASIFPKGLLFYYIALFYPVLTFIFEMGVALILVYPVKLILQWFKKHVIFEFIAIVVILLGVTYLYSQVLNVFISLVANNNINSLFNAETIAGFIQFRANALPINFLSDVFLAGSTSAVLPYLCITLGIFILGISLTIFAFHYVRSVSYTAKSKTKKREYKKHSVTYALVKKEVSLLVKDSDYIFSFTGLLIIQPFLLYLVISAINVIFNSGTFRYYLILVPNFIGIIDVLIIMMFTLIINQGANRYISMEKHTIKNMKTIPVSFRKQLTIKMMIPFSLSFVSLLISLLVLLFTSVISISAFVGTLVLSTLVLFIFDLISMREELNIRHNKPRSATLSTVFSYVLPFAYVILGFVLSIFDFNIWLIYLMGVVLFIALGLPHAMYIQKNIGSLFLDLEAVN